jgi:amino acid adenylation domain-containing protein
MRSRSDEGTATRPPAWLPMSQLQRGMWWEQQLAPESPAYTLCNSARLEGPVDVGALQEALDVIVARHAVLRTTFVVRDGEPGQVVHSPRPAALSIVDLTSRPAPERWAAVDGICAAEARRVFDLTRLPLWRTTLIRLAPELHVLVVARHHLVSDGRSMTVWFEELDAAYLARVHGVPAALPPLSAQYVDVIRRQQTWLSSAECARQTRYWQHQLAGAASGLVLSPDYPSPRAAGTVGASESGPLPARVLRPLTAMAHAHAATSYMALLAVFQLVLHRYGAGALDLVVRSPIDARGEVAFESLIGFLINTVVLRARLTGDPPFVVWLAQVRDTVLAAQANADVPFPHVVAAMHAVEGSEAPLRVPIEFVYQAWPAQRGHVLGLPADIRIVESGAVRSTLALCVDQIGDEGWLRAEYRTDVFAPATIARLLRSIGAVAQQVASDPSQRLSTISVLAPADRRVVLLEVNRTGRKGTRRSVQEWVAQTSVSPDAPAVIAADGTTTWTHGALQVEVHRVASRLRSTGVGAGTFVAVCLPRTIDLIVALWGIVEAGAAFVPLDPEAPLVRRREMLADCGARVLIADASASGWAGPDLQVMAPRGSLEPLPPPLPPVSPDGHHPAYVMYTSGSTGRPKGVVITQRGLCNRLRWMLDAFDFATSDRVVLKTPYTFDASVWEWMAPRLVGGAVVLAEPGGHRDPASLIRTMRATGVTILQVVPSLLRALVEEPGLESCGALRQVFCAGEVLQGSLVKRWRERLTVPLCNTYGPTEAAIDVTAWRCKDDASDSAPIGRPIDNTRVYVLDETGAPAPVGVVGNLYVAGTGLAQGYLRQPALTAERFVPCPFGAPGERMYRTGDRARWRMDGVLEFAGRTDTQVKLRGVRIELEEIETLLEAQPGVTRAVVVVADVGGMPTLTACVAASEPGIVGTLREAMAAIMPTAQQPARYVPLEALPLTQHGKVDRAAVALLARDAPAVPLDSRPPRDAADTRIAQLWEEVLGVPVDDCATSFFAFGGHSLLAVRLLARLEQQLGLTISIAEFFEEPTVAGLRRRARPLPPVPDPLPSDTAVRLSFAQQRLWFLDQWGPRTGVYTVAEAYRLEGVLDVVALRAAVAAIVRRHEALRTRIVTEGGHPRAEIDADAAVDPFEIVDLRSLCTDEAAAQAAAHRRAAARRPVDLQQTPLVRATLVRLTDTTADLVIALPHVISDATSSAVLRAELAAHYRAARRGQPSVLPSLIVQYRDYVAWERGQLTPDRLADGLRYWEAQLADVPVLALPTDRPRRANEFPAGAVETTIVAPSLRQVLAQLCRREGVTVFMLLLAAFQTLLHRYTGEDDLAVGTVISQRRRLVWDPLIGLFLNTLVLRTDLGGDPSFRQLLRRVRAVALGAYAHADVPFDRVVEALQPPRDPRHAPLCQVMFVHQHAPEPGWMLDDVCVTPLGVDNGGAKFDLTLAITEYAEGMAVTAEYATALFDATSITRLLGHYTALLEGIVVAPDTRLSQLPLMDAVERTRSIALWSGAAHADGRPAEPLVPRLQRAARVHAERVAVVCGDQRLTYRELDETTNRLARRLRALGVGPDVCVALCVPLSIDLVVGILAILKAGGAYMPLDPVLPSARIDHALEVTRAAFLIVTPAARLPESVPQRTGVSSLEALLDGARACSSTPLQTDAPGSTLAYVILTSGSTGDPKAAGVEHRGLAQLVEWYTSFGFSPSDRTLVITSPGFDLTQKNIFVPLITGGQIHFPTWHPSDYRAASRAIAQAGITTLNCTPTAIYPLLDAAGPDSFVSLHTLRHVFLGGEPIAAARLMPWLKAPGTSTIVVNTYGPTECTDVVSSHVIDPAGLSAETPIPIGRAVPGTVLAVLDSQLDPVPENLEGDLCIRGIAVGRGYLNSARMTADRFRPDPFATRPGARLYHTGDRVRLRGDGELEFLGRADRQIKVRGFRIEPGEIETVLERHVGVRRAVVTTHEAGPDDVRLVAYLVERGGQAPSPRELRAHLCRSLPEFMVPAAYVSMSTLPLTRSGKIDYRALPAPSDGHWTREAELVAASTENEMRLAEIWSSLLGVGRLSVHDDFFAAGGHSLLAAQLAARIGQAFALDLPLHVVFEYSTIARLAEYIDAVLVAVDGRGRRADRPHEENRV